MDFYIISTYNRCMQFGSKKVLLLIIGIWIVLAVFFYAGINILLQSGVLYKTILNKTGLNYEAKNLKTNLDLGLNLIIKADSIKILDADKKNCFITVINPKITFRPMSLLFKRVYLKRADSDNISINIKRDENGNIDLLNAVKVNISKLPNIRFTKFNSKIGNIEFNFSDNYGTKSDIKLSLDDSNILFSKRKNTLSIKENGIITTSINGLSNEKSDIKVDIKYDYKTDNGNFNVDLNNIDLYIFSDVLRKYISNDISSVKGIADLSLKTDENTHKLNLKINKPYLKLKDGKIINPYKELSAVSDFLLDFNKLTINNFEILSNGLNISTLGTITSPFSDKRNVDLVVEFKNTQLNNFLYLIPDNLIFYRPQGIPNLKKSDFHGTLGGKINLKLFPVDITGNLKIENIYIPNYPKSFQQNDATLFFMKDKMRVYSRVYTPDNEYVTIDGVSNLDDSLYGKYNVKSTKKINLSFAQKYLVPIQQIIGFNIGPVPIMDITGYGNIDIKTQGTIKDAQIFGQFNAYNASAYIHGLDAKLVNGDCKLIFDNRNLIFKEIKGDLDGAKFLLTGMGNTKGEVNLNAKITNAYVSKIIKMLNNSQVSKNYTSLFKNIAAVSGLMNAEVNLKGVIKDYETEELLNDLALSGNFELKNDKIVLNNGLGIKNVTGVLNFDENSSQNGFFKFDINNSKFNATVDVKDKLSKIVSTNELNLNLALNSQKCAMSDILFELKHLSALNKNFQTFMKELNDIDFYSKVSLNLNTKVSLNNLNFNNLKTNGYIVGLNSSKNKNIEFKQGLIRIVNNNIIFDNFKTIFFDGVIQAKGSSDNGLKISLQNINLEIFDKLLPKTKLQNAIVKSGEIFINKNDLKLNVINIDYNKMPVVLNLAYKINSKDNEFSADFSTILNETTADYTINPYLTYPVKLKGEVPVKGKFSGNTRNYFIDFTTSLPSGADIYFSGGNVGDIEQDREITGKINVNGNALALNNLRLIKYIKNQNNKINPLTAINLNGRIVQKSDGIYFDNFKVATLSPINVRILNTIFKKSILKKGNFECNVNLSGNTSSPDITGKINLQDIDIPLYDTQINNIKINITPNNIVANLIAKNGESDLKADINAVNNFNAPYVINKVSIESDKFSVHEILESLPSQNHKSDISKKQEFSIRPQDIVVKDGYFNFANVTFNKMSAQNFKGNFSYKDNVFDMKQIVFDIANGQVSGSGNYNIDSTKLNLKANMKDCDSNILAKDFLNISGQIYGLMTGTIDLTAKNINSPDNIKNVDSSLKFTIDSGKMPKLGSLEYLLRAGNLVRNGLLGLSLNNLIQVLTPYKTGEFEKISGSLKITDGMIKDLEISSKGKNLSMYLTGEYKILEQLADISLYGRLSQNVSNAMGAVGNASILQFINTFARNKTSERSEELQESLDNIPLVEGSNQGVYFSAKVYGDINKDNYIKKFNWE